MRVFVSILLLCIFYQPLSAQKAIKHARKGNEFYEKGSFTDAEIQYRKSLEKQGDFVKAQFNLGNALYKQENYKESAKVWKEMAARDIDMNLKIKAWHNLGNAYLKDKQYEQSIEAFKNSLRMNPSDMDTKYNLAYAQKMLKQQQQQQDKNNQNENNQNENKEKENNKEQDQKKSEEQDQKNQEQQQNQQKNQEEEKEQQQAQRKEGQMTKEDAERMMQALQNDELKTLRKLNVKKAKGSRSTIEKDW